MKALLAVVVLQVALAVTAAPGDQYFGKLKMSALRIRYETMQLKKRYENHDLRPEQAEHLLLLTEDAFHDWARLYPKDSWLASTGFAMAQLYAELPGTPARDRAVALFVYVKSSFPASSYARQSRDELHRGVPTKPEPAWAIATASPAALPTQAGAASSTPSGVPSTTPPGAPSTTPSAAASPRPRM